jgi:anti-sigma factor RsiW
VKPATDLDPSLRQDAPIGGAPDGRSGPPDADESLRSLARKLIDDIKAAAADETALLKARGQMASDGARRAALWGAIAGGALLIGALTLIFGAILALAPLLGPVLATLLAGTMLLLIAAVAGWKARAGVSDIRLALKERGDDPHWKGDV